MRIWLKVGLIAIGLFIYLFAKIVHDRSIIEYSRSNSNLIKCKKIHDVYKCSCDSLSSYTRIVDIAKGKINMVFPKKEQKIILSK